MDSYIRTRTLEITVISGENMYVDGNPVGETANVAVRTESIKSWSTKMAKGSSLGYPLWNEKLLVEMPLHARSITLEVQCKTSKGSVRSIGVARIAVSDILGGEGESESESESEGTLQKQGCLHVFSYRLRNWEGRRNGVLNFSARVVKKKEEECEKDMMVISNSCGGFKHEINDLNNNDGVVIGVPLWWNNHLAIHV